MKYIRTKNGIYEVEDEIIITPYLDKGWEKVFKIVDNNECIKEQDVISQADTIEELCDELLIKYITSSKPYVADEYQKTQILNDRQKTFFYGVEAVYGAIYTNKGLIYVAKLNDKGELELI